MRAGHGEGLGVAVVGEAAVREAGFGGEGVGGDGAGVFGRVGAVGVVDLGGRLVVGGEGGWGRGHFWVGLWRG